METFNAKEIITQLFRDLGFVDWTVSLDKGSRPPKNELALTLVLDDYDLSNQQNLNEALLPILDSVLDSPAVRQEIDPLRKEASDLRAKVARLSMDLQDALVYKAHYNLQYQMQHGKTIE